VADPPRRVGSRVAAQSGRGLAMDLRSFPARESRYAVSGVTPSDACGLGRAASSAKGWVLAMLAREAARCAWLWSRASAAPFFRPPMPGPANRTRGGGRRHNAGGTSRAEKGSTS
jgi:hypothetical protein